jgi:DNA modification methylase
MIQNKDCLDFLSEVEDGTVDLIVTDPPYFQIVKNEWDNQWSNEEEYLEWCEKWTAECVRVLKPNRCLYVWGTTKTDTFLRYKLEVLNNQPEMVYQSWIIWSYDWGGRTKKNFARKHEDLLMYSKGKEFLFNADEVCVERSVKKNMALTRKISLLQKRLDDELSLEDDGFAETKDGQAYNTYRLGKIKDEDIADAIEVLKQKETSFEKGKIPTDVWPKNNHTTSKEYCGWHPTQKPVELLERIIKANTNKGDFVLDIFSGSGSTAIAAEKSGRIGIGCEMDKEYYEKSLERLTSLTKEV